MLHRFVFACCLALALMAGAAPVACAELAESFDLVVVGGSPAGVACAVRAAREGLSVLLVERTGHLGGFMASGAGGWEAPWDGPRCPLYAETLAATADYYRATYGGDSPQYRASLPQPTGNRHIDRPKVEPRVIEMVFDQMTSAESRLTVLRGYFPVAVERAGRLVQGVTLRKYQGTCEVTVRGRMFADATYEADLAALAGAPYRVGRESRDEFNEPHAGVIYCRGCPRAPGQQGFPLDAAEGRLRTRMFPMCNEVIAGGSTGAGDKSVMAYNYRLILTDNPANRVPNPKPENYNAEMYRRRPGDFKAGSIVPNIPNRKIGWNAGRLVGPQNDYPEGDWPTRERISRQYLDAVLGLLWFLQHDESVSESERTRWQAYGLARDEFIDNNHLPYEVYVREARRLVGRYVFTQHDGSVEPRLARTPVHADSVAITDWPMDSVACTSDLHGPGHEGAYFLSNSSRPAQVPYRTMLPREFDNLLVPLCVSATHVGWGAIRLEPVWLQLGESAGFAAALSRETGTLPGTLDHDRLVRRLVERRVMVAMFNDIDMSDDGPHVAPVQYFANRGCFASYDARPNDPLDATTADVWLKIFAQRRTKSNDAPSPSDFAARLPGGGEPAARVDADRWVGRLARAADVEPAVAAAMLKECHAPNAGPLSRGAACLLMYRLLDGAGQHPKQPE